MEYRLFMRIDWAPVCKIDDKNDLKSDIKFVKKTSESSVAEKDTLHSIRNDTIGMHKNSLIDVLHLYTSGYKVYNEIVRLQVQDKKRK